MDARQEWEKQSFLVLDANCTDAAARSSSRRFARPFALYCFDNPLRSLIRSLR